MASRKSSACRCSSHGCFFVCAVIVLWMMWYNTVCVSPPVFLLMSRWTAHLCHQYSYAIYIFNAILFISCAHLAARFAYLVGVGSGRSFFCGAPRMALFFF